MNSKKAVRCDVMPTTIVQDGPNKHDIVDNFAYVSNGELIISGTDTLQVLDILGRQVSISNLSSLTRWTHEGMVGRWFLVFPWPRQLGQLEFRS